MRKLFRAVTGRPKLILAVFLICAAACLFLQRGVSVNYDMRDYLPQDTGSTAALELMRREFDGGIPNARVMVRDVTVAEALAYKQALLACEGVEDVTWLDDAADIREPMQTLDADVVSAYYQDGAALFTVTIDEDERLTAVPAIRAVIGDNNAMSGDAVTSAVATVDTVSEISLIASAAVAFVVLVLLLTTQSWLEPAVVMLGLGVAIAINAGTNLIFGEISFVTNAAGSILQLAVSLDYSVFLLHRFEECLQDEPDPRSAMVDALCKSCSSILSSGLTTVIGFLALVFMRFRLGPDLGLALAKGVCISLLTVFVFMPCLILTLHKPLQRLRHRALLPDFHKFGKLVSRVTLPLACVFALLIAPCFLASNANDFYYGASRIYDEQTQLGADMAAIEDVFGQRDTYVLLVPRGDTASEQALSDALHGIPQVKGILSYVDTVGAEIPMEYLPADTLKKLVSENYSRMILTVEADSEGEGAFALVERIRAEAQARYPGEWYLAGEAVSTYDLMDTITADMLEVNLIAIGAVFLVLLLSMRSAVLPVILVLAIETAIWINLALPYFADTVVFYISYLIISSIQLGATVDYAILFTDRYMEFRRTLDKREAAVQTVRAVTVSILTSGSVLTVVGFLMGGISTHGILAQLGMFLGMGGLLSMTIVLFVLPGLLGLLDGVIRRTTHGAGPRSEKTQEAF